MTNQQMIDKIWENISQGLDISGIDWIYVRFAGNLNTREDNAFYLEYGKAKASYNTQKTLREHYKIICGDCLIPFATEVYYLPDLDSQESIA